METDYCCRVLREWANHASSWSGEGEVGAGGMWRTFMGFSKCAQPALCHMEREVGALVGWYG